MENSRSHNKESRAPSEEKSNSTTSCAPSSPSLITSLDFEDDPSPLEEEEEAPPPPLAQDPDLLETPKKGSKSSRKRKRDEKEEKARLEMESWIASNSKSLKREKKEAQKIANRVFQLRDLIDFKKAIEKEFRAQTGKGCNLRMTHTLPLFHFLASPTCIVDRISKFDEGGWKAMTTAGMDRCVDMMQQGLLTPDLEEIVRKKYDKKWWKVSLTSSQRKYLYGYTGKARLTLVNVKVNRDDGGGIISVLPSQLKGYEGGHESSKSNEEEKEGEEEVPIVWLTPVMRVEKI